MKLKDARRQAIALARTMDEGVVAVVRIGKRMFDFIKGYGSQGCDLVMIVSSEWAREGYYDEYHPE